MADPRYPGTMRNRAWLIANVFRTRARGTDPVVVADLVASTPNLIDDAVAITQAVQGNAGPRGKASAPLSGQRLVTIDSDGVRYYDPLRDSPVGPLGLTTAAYAAGADVTTAASGLIEEPSWSLVPNTPVFAGLGGILTQTPPEVGVLRVVGTAVKPHQLYLSIREGSIRG